MKISNYSKTKRKTLSIPFPAREPKASRVPLLPPLRDPVAYAAALEILG